MWTSGNGLLKRPFYKLFVMDVKECPLQMLNLSVTGLYSPLLINALSVTGYLSPLLIAAVLVTGYKVWYQ
jgi:hypothetical protein